MPNRIRSYHLALTASVALFSACAAAASAASVVDSAQAASSAKIRWDTYGVPHIYGPDVLTVERGLGYAQMQAQAETLLNTIARARGRAAEYFGPGPGGQNIVNDTNVRSYGIPGRAADWLARGGAEQASMLAAFCAGANEYAKLHGDAITPGVRSILPIVPTDITASEQYTIWFTFIPNQDNISGGNPYSPGLLVSTWLAGGIKAANAVARNMVPTGSNAWALAPSKSTSGNSILMGNPHLPWGNNQPASGLGIYQWLEVNLVVGDPSAPTINATGVTFAGGSFIGIGFNDYLGWSHTNNTIQASNLYQLRLDATGTKYAFAGKLLPLDIHTDYIQVRRADGTLERRAIIVKSSVHGPVVATSADGKTALALRIAGLDQPSLSTQYWHMIESTNMAQFVAADSMLQMPFFNVIYADRGGNIMYKFGGRQPVRDGGSWGDYAGILDGADPAKLWTRTATWEQLPGAVNPPGGFVANSNNPPWTSAFPQPATLNPANYPAYVAPQFMDFRPQHGANFLLSQPTFSVDEVLAGKMSTHMTLADRVLPDLITAANVSGDPVAMQAATVLSAWDRTGDAPSVGGVLFEKWWDLVVADVAAGKLPADTSDDFYSPHPQFATPWERHHPLSTPVGLANPAQLVPYLTTAANTIEAEFGSRGGISVPWGAAHFSVLGYHDGSKQLDFSPLSNDPQSGADDPFGPIRVTNPFYVPAIGEYVTIGGDGWVQLVEFTPQGANAQVLLDYGNSSRPKSPHITDQLPFFDSKTLRPALRTFAAVSAATVSTENY